MLVDSHCHLDRLDLVPFQNSFDTLVEDIRSHDIGHMLCVCIDIENFHSMKALVEPYKNISISVGVHPNDKDRHEPSAEELAELSQSGRVVAIGESGLDYFRSEGDLAWQRDRFRRHIQAAHLAKKPLIIHTRAAKADTIQLMEEERARDVGGVMHCFTEDWVMAKQALDLGFYISFSGIVTFNSAKELQEVAAKVPDDRILIETDSPYLSPVPKRGKPNVPQYVTHVADKVAKLRGVTREKLEEITTENFFKAFPLAQPRQN